jgi:hypothetical protein
MPRRWSDGPSTPLAGALLALSAPVLGLLFIAGLPLLGLAAIAWGLARPAPETPARPAGGPAEGHQEPRPPGVEPGASR